MIEALDNTRKMWDDHVSDPTCVGIGLLYSIIFEECTNFERTLSVHFRLDCIVTF